MALKVLKISPAITKSQVKKLDGLYKNIDEMPVYLIGQLGKNDDYQQCISGKEIVDYALSIILKSFQLVGGRIILHEQFFREFVPPCGGFLFISGIVIICILESSVSGEVV